jgi:hypothetical protein
MTFVCSILPWSLSASTELILFFLGIFLLFVIYYQFRVKVLKKPYQRDPETTADLELDIGEFIEKNALKLDPESKVNYQELYAKLLQQSRFQELKKTYEQHSDPAVYRKAYKEALALTLQEIRQYLSQKPEDVQDGEI